MVFLVRRYYGIKQTKFTDRVFNLFEEDSKEITGKLDLRAFVAGIWNYCTYDARQLARVAFGFFDVDRLGYIDMVSSSW